MKGDYNLGLFFVFEGIDGSGKSVQTRLLSERLEHEGYKVKQIEFPQYGKKSAGMIEEYLAGKYGNAQDVDSRAASIFYAQDRFDLSFQIREWLHQGYTLVADRYVGSNMGHQGSKFGNEGERTNFFEWLYDLEYTIFRIPKPTISIYLHVPADIAQVLSNNVERRRIKKSDIHEKDIQHLKDAEIAYLHALKVFPEHFTLVECMENATLLEPEYIHNLVWLNVKEYLV
jgi:dTMP kinase